MDRIGKIKNMTTRKKAAKLRISPDRKARSAYMTGLAKHKHSLLTQEERSRHAHKMVSARKWHPVTAL